MAGKNYVDPLLTRISKGHTPRGHVNHLILPGLPVKKDTAKIADFGSDNMRIVSTLKSPAGATPVIDYNVSQVDSYKLEKHALKAFASDERAENQDDPFNEQADAIRLVTDLLSLEREYGLSKFMSTSSNFTNKATLSGADQWGGASDDPVANINLGIATVADEMNVDPSEISMVIESNVYRKLVGLSEIIGSFIVPPTIMLPAQLAAMFGIRQVIVAKGRYNSAMKGQADSFTNLWGKHCWLAYIPPAPQERQDCFGYTVFKDAGDVSDKWRDEDAEGWWCRRKTKYDQYIMNEKGVYMIADAIA